METVIYVLPQLIYSRAMLKLYYLQCVYNYIET